MPLCREGFLCPSPIQHQRWTWPQRLPSPPSHSTPPPSQPLIYQRPTTSRAKRSTPKKLGRARNPPRHYSSNQFVKAADSQVTSRYIRDGDLAEVESFTSRSFFICCVTHRHPKKAPHSFLAVCHEISSTSPSQQLINCARIRQKLVDCIHN